VQKVPVALNILVQREQRLTMRQNAKARRDTTGVSLERMREVYADAILPHPTDVVGFLLWRALLAYQHRVEEKLNETGITHLQFAVLATAGWLSLDETEVSQRDIVRQSGIKEAQVSLMVKTLRAKGLLIQARGARDPRVRAIRLTERGARALEAALPLIHAVQQELWPSTVLQDEMSTMLLATLQRWETT
jgi:DNA-binding MarR family transcriptional regulator